MEPKLFMSERCIAMLDKAMQQLEPWHFDAINAPILLEQIIIESKSLLHEYMLNEGLEQDDEELGYIQIYLMSRQKKLHVESKEGEKAEFKSEHDADVTFEDQEGKLHKYPVADEILKIFENTGTICKNNKVKIIEPIHITIAMFAVNNRVLKELFHDLEFDFNEAKKYFTNNEALKLGVIPHTLSGFLTCLNDMIDAKKPCEILMRDKEVEQIWNISLKRNKRNTIIVGEAGVGKSALIEKITYDIVKGICPERFKNFSVISLDVNSLIAGTSFRGQAEERIKELIKFLEEHHNVILFIDEVHTILGAGSCFEGEMDLANALKPILARGDTIVIGATTISEYEMYFASDAALSRRFERIVVTEPQSTEVYPMIKNKVQALSKFHNVKISKSMVEYIIMIANCFAFEKRNPDKTLDLIDRSMVAAYRSGKRNVDKESVIANFDIFFELFQGMDEDSRKEVAYHEVGHYIVGKASDKLVELKMLAISILPAEDYLGVTCYENAKNIMPFRNKEYYIDLLAFYLGGRVAEKVFRKDFTSGAGEDLNYVTQLAFIAVTKYGMSSDGADRNNIFLNTKEYPMFSERSTNLVNKEVQKFIELAYKRAENIIERYKELLELLVKKLLERKIMSETELDRIWHQYMQKIGDK